MPSSAHATDKVCLNCHAENIFLSKEPCSRWQVQSHPVYVRPSRDVTVPSQFPLNDRGEIDCNTCHDVFGTSPPKPDKVPTDFTGKFLLRGKQQNSIMCKQCHAPKVAVALEQSGAERYGMIWDKAFNPDKVGDYIDGRKKFYNHPVDIQMPRLPRKITDSGGREGIEKDQIICETCHTAHFAAGDSLLVIDNSESELCGQCHSAKFGRDRESTADKGTHPVNIVPSTSALFTAITSIGGKLGRNKKIVCLTCHSIHMAVVRKGLLVKKDDKNSFCFLCHQDIADKIEGSRHDMRLTAPEEKNAWGLTAEEGGVCSSCHVIHNGKNIKMWAKTIEKPDREDPIKSLCSSCHSKGKPGAGKQTGAHSHPTGVSISRADNPYVKLPLFTKGGVRVGQGMVTCSSCHNVHQWDPDSTDKGGNLKVDGNSKNSFLRKRNLQSVICFECHRSPRLIEGTSHDLNTAVYQKSLAPQLVFKGIRKVEGSLGICDHCHTVHNAVSVMLWARQIGTGDDNISRICFSCHSDSMVAQNKQIGGNTHPVNISIDVLGPDANPELPLFTDNLRKEIRGKIFCNTCHDSHRRAPDISVKDGGKASDASNNFLRISAAGPKNNLCRECHPQQGLVTGTDHDLQVLAPESKNLKGWKPRQSGVCGVCHSAHNALTQVMLWNQPFGSGDDVFSRACNSCHADKKCASEKKVGISHPVNVSTFAVLDDLSSTSLPIYDEKYRAVTIEMDPSLSPRQIQSILTLEKEHLSYRDDPNLVQKFNYLKRIYIDIKGEKDLSREKLISFIEEKNIMRKSLIQNEVKFKKIDEETAQKGDRYRQLKDDLRKLKQRKSLRQGELRAIRQEMGIAEEHLNSHSKPSPSMRKKLLQDKRFITAQKEYAKAVKNLDAVKKEFVALGKDFKKITSIRDKINLDNNKMRSDYNELNIKQEKENIKYKLLKSKTIEIKLQLKDINPRSFMEVERDLKNEMRIGEKLLNESEMNFKIKYLTLLAKKEGLETKDDKVRGKYRSMRTRYMDLLLKPDLRKKISKMEVDAVLDEELMDEMLRDVENEPQGKMFCTTCHDVHRWNAQQTVDGPGKNREGDKMSSFLRIPNAGGYQLCINCHREKEWVIGTDHDMGITASEEKNILGETSADNGVCGACHLVHNAADKFNIWAKKIDREKIDRLTAARKREKKLKKLIGLWGTELKQVTTSLKKIKPPKAPKYQALERSKAKRVRLRKKLKHVNKLKRLSPEQRELVRTKYKQQISFLNKYVNKATNIFQKSARAAKKVKYDYNKLKKNIEDAKAEYKPLEKNISLMEEELSRSNWDAHSLLCNSCHGVGLSAGKKVIGYNSHPMNVRGRNVFAEEEDASGESDSESEFEDEKKASAMDRLQKMLAYPLYTQEGRRDFESGRMFCPTCHNVHQWAPLNPSRGSGVSQEGDAQNSFLRDNLFPKPTLCINCHPQNVLVVGTEHDLSVSAPDTKNFQGKTAATGGICSPCHAVHNSYDRYRLWARPLGPSNLPSWSRKNRLKKFKPVQLCTSCHQEKQIGEQKIPGEGLHNLNPFYYLKEVERILVQPEFPYFDYNYKNKEVRMGVREILHGAKPKYLLHTPDGKISDKGQINCLTCHNPHIWDMNNKKEGPGKPVEGDVTNSFLKKDIAKNFCSDCHKTEALYNFTYFHLSDDRFEIKQKINSDNPHWKKMLDEKSCKTCHQNEPQVFIHPVGITLDKESAQYKYPEKLPLEKDKIICTSCHNPKIQTKKFASSRDKNRFFLRGLHSDLSQYDSVTQTDSVNKTGTTMFGGPPTSMLQLMAGPKNLGSSAPTGKTNEDTAIDKPKTNTRFLLYQVCFNCHKKEEYQQFSPHRYQIADGRINPEMCSLCHTEIPDRRNIQQNNKERKLRAKIEFFCINCHRGKDKTHPGGARHFGKTMTSKILKQFETGTAGRSSGKYLPLKKGKLVCPSCHNIHQEGVILAPGVGGGRRENNWLRLKGKDICTTCHKRSSHRTPVSGGSPF